MDYVLFPGESPEYRAARDSLTPAESELFGEHDALLLYSLMYGPRMYRAISRTG